MPKEMHGPVGQVWQALVEKKGGTRGTNVNITRDGTLITCEWYNSTLIDDLGRTIGVASLVNDITERKKMESEFNRKLKDLERFNRLVVGREIRMLQLKREINGLRMRLGQSARYILPAEAEGDVARKPESARELHKRALFDLAMIGDITRGRPTLGSSMDVALYRLMQFSLKAVLVEKLGSEAVEAFYFKAGELSGKELYRSMMPKGKCLNDFFSDIQDLLADLNIGIVKIERSDPVNMHFILTVAEDVDCSGLPDTNETICTYDEGLLSGLLCEHTGTRFHVKEIDCWCSGDTLCRYEIKPAAMT